MKEKGFRGFIRPSKHGYCDLYRSVLDNEGLFQKELCKFKGMQIEILIHYESEEMVK